ncbi:MAG: sulfotransferase [Pseudomonadota bacterium]
MADQRAIIVLGMHRSGTSAVSGVLARMGCAPPKTMMPASAANERGFYESLEVYELHNTMLEEAESAWSDWRPMPKDWFASKTANAFKSKAAKVLEQEFADAPLFVLKDPRICRLFQFWQGVLKKQRIMPLILHIHRNPLEVAASLHRHHNMAEEVALLLWLRHVLDSEAATRDQKRHFVQYDGLLKDWAKEVARIQTAFGLALSQSEDAEDVEGFVSPDLRHFQDDAEAKGHNPALAGWVGTVFDVLTRWADKGEDPADHATLDQITDSLASATPFLSRVLDQTAELRTTLAAAGVGLSKLQGELTDAITDHEITQAEQEAALKAERLRHASTQDALDAERERAISAEKKLSSVQADLKARIKEYEKSLSKASSSQEALNRTQLELTELRVDTQMRIEALKEALSAERSAKSQMQSNLTALRNSRSWRLTAPLRGVMRLLRGA